MKITFKKLVHTAILGILLEPLGGYLNHTAMKANGGTMPVWVINDSISDALVGDLRHSPLTNDSKDKVLCDIFVIPEINSYGLEFEDVASAGDLLIWAGRCLVILATMFLIVLPFKLIGKGFSWLWKVISWLHDNISVSLK